jgi:hypothetical protein
MNFQAAEGRLLPPEPFFLSGSHGSCAKHGRPLQLIRTGAPPAAAVVPSRGIHGGFTRRALGGTSLAGASGIAEYG